MSEYDQEIKIDINSLDQELVRQPSLFLQVSQDHAQAVSVRDGLKEAVSVAWASAEGRIRQEAAEEDRKLTEAMVKSEVEMDRRYRRAVDAYLTAREAADQAFAIKESFAQRAFVLKDLCSLYVAGYFATNAVGGPGPGRLKDDRRDALREAYRQKSSRARRVL
ncbi:MAG: hypothetical protein WC378_00160 [Opitutaceae bacterium]|jgi:hypothetical protein